jgi:NAD(P)-dependent dehydrogenase (short-subunit alcohol dehydrogenase family)
MEPMAGRLDGKVAIVVGAGCAGPGWGNGRAMAVIFAREGATVFAVDRDEESMRETRERAREAGGEITSYLCEATDSKAVAAMVDACVKAHGRVDILVNNVGGSAAGGPVELPEDAWHRQLDYNLGTVFLACKYVLPIMVRQNGGAIVNVSSASGIRFSGSPQVGYAASKAGVIQFSRVVAVQYASHGIRVNTVIPGQLHTQWSKPGSPNSAPAATSRPFSSSVSPAFRWASWVMDAIRRTRRCFSPPTKRASSPGPKSWSMAV